MKKVFCKVLVVLLFITGLVIMLYPAISNYLMSKNQTTAIQNYKYTVEEMKKEETDKLLEEARKYNESYVNTFINDEFSSEAYSKDNNYKKILNINGVMGYIEIPKINVNLPIYHGTSEEVLKKGIGHLETTPLPIGGIGIHSVLSGHRGLASAKLLTDLDKIDIGDIFNIYILSEVLTYKVNQVKVVEPHETGDLQAENNKDYITLITCTPYAVNTHRLLIRGEREMKIESGNINSEVENNIQVQTNNNESLNISYKNTYFKNLLLVLLIIIIIFIMLLYIRKQKNKKSI